MPAFIKAGVLCPTILIAIQGCVLLFCPKKKPQKKPI